MIISVGERLSAKIFAAVLKEKTRLNAVFVSLEHILDPKLDVTGSISGDIAGPAAAVVAASANHRDQSFYDLIKSRMATAVQAHLTVPDSGAFDQQCDREATIFFWRGE